MKKQFFRNSTIGWTAICIMSLSLLGQSQPPKDATDRHREPFGGVTRYLDMSPVQVERFIELRQHQRECVAPSHEAVKELKAQLKEALPQGASSEEIGDLVIEIYQIEQEIHQCFVAYRQAFADMLDDKQLDKMERLQAAARLRPVIGAFSALRLLHTPTNPPETDVGDDGGGV